MPAVMTIPELERFLAGEFPQAFYPESGLSIEAVWDGGCLVRQAFREVSLRPGGTISGPTMMALADLALYVAVLAAIGTRHRDLFDPPRPARAGCGNIKPFV
jgi:acyl-coenzyme A thioesterase PaaI-like protein